MSLSINLLLFRSLYRHISFFDRHTDRSFVFHSNMAERDAKCEDKVVIRFFDYTFAPNDYPYKKKLLDKAKITKNKKEAALLRSAASAVMTDVLMDVVATRVEEYIPSTTYPDTEDVVLVRLPEPFYHRKLYYHGPVLYVLLVKFKYRDAWGMLPVDTSRGKQPLPPDQPFVSARPLKPPEYDDFATAALSATALTKSLSAQLYQHA